MTLSTLPQAKTIKEQYEVLQNKEPKIRARNAARKLGISEMELLAAGVNGIQAQPLKAPAQNIFKELGILGRVMALTRNEWCVHERHGAYEDIRAGKTMGLVVGPDIDLRMFFTHWGRCWAVNDNGRHSLQFFDLSGHAVHKVFCTEETNLISYQQIVQNYAENLDTWPETLTIDPYNSYAEKAPEEFREQWLSMKDTHEFHGLLKKFNLARLTALQLIGNDLAQQVSNAQVETMLHDVAQQKIPFMCFTGNSHMVQIHSGPIEKILRTGNWLNILDPIFNLHLDTTAITETWIVNRPSKDGWITSLECFAANGDLIVQFFGARKPGVPELSEWRQLMTNYCDKPLAA